LESVFLLTCRANGCHDFCTVDQSGGGVGGRGGG
jgi:hypothetical protein